MAEFRICKCQTLVKEGGVEMAPDLQRSNPNPAICIFDRREAGFTWGDGLLHQVFAESLEAIERMKGFNIERHMEAARLQDSVMPFDDGRSHPLSSMTQIWRSCRDGSIVGHQGDGSEWTLLDVVSQRIEAVLW